MAADTSAATRRRKPAAEPGATRRLREWLRAYEPIPGVPDELFDARGRPRDHWLDFLGHFAAFPAGDPGARFALPARHLRDAGVAYRPGADEAERTWPIDPLPLILTQAEWDEISAGVAQRARLMEALLRDIYGPARMVAEGRLPAAALTGSGDFIRAVRGIAPPGGRHTHIYAADLGRGPDGRWWVLGDRTQAPSGLGYALENRLAVSRAFPNLYNTMNVHRLAPFFDAHRRGLASAADRSDPRICLLTPGKFSETYDEQAHLARYLGFLLVEGDDLVARDGKVYVRTIAGLKRADVILRRVDSGFIDPLELNNASRLGTPGMLEAIRAGGVTVLNMPGSGVLESRALMGFLPRLCQELLGEDLAMPHVATWWCGQPAEQALVESRLDDLAIAPAFNAPGGDSILSQSRMVADMTPAERDGLIRNLQDRPADFVGQEVVRLSTMPVLKDDRLSPAPFVLRVFAASTPDGIRVMPGGFCRTSDRPDVRAISMGEGARAADVWVIGEKPVERMTLMPSADSVQVRRIMGHLPSRAADNLFWLGRYMERAECTLRAVRSLCTSSIAAEAAAHAAGETFESLQLLLTEWGALRAPAADVVHAAGRALLDPGAWGSVISTIRAEMRTAASMRERLSADFWALLVGIEGGLAKAGRLETEADVLRLTNRALQTMAALSGLAQENMNRVAGWRFLDIGRRIERGVNACRLSRLLARDEATTDDLDLLLDLNDSQITYRARYLAGLALTPVRDLVMLDPFNTRSLAFQLQTLKEHLSVLPPLNDDGMLEEPQRILLTLVADVETEDARKLSADKALRFERALMRFSNAVADRYFLQGASAVPTVKLVGLA
ncbi:circularly permuted type 2 ATP-grasp protein [Phenylobacterium sp.]|uniref:circularly permuted type 2 ATP-grasp protein n=1 Tax=Phenylobacterium sp. TaxID=1871053 RepID=UPI00301C347C